MTGHVHIYICICIHFYFYLMLDGIGSWQPSFDINKLGKSIFSHINLIFYSYGKQVQGIGHELIMKNQDNRESQQVWQVIITIIIIIIIIIMPMVKLRVLKNKQREVTDYSFCKISMCYLFAV